MWTVNFDGLAGELEKFLDRVPLLDVVLVNLLLPRQVSLLAHLRGRQSLRQLFLNPAPLFLRQRRFLLLLFLLCFVTQLVCHGGKREISARGCPGRLCHLGWTLLSAAFVADGDLHSFLWFCCGTHTCSTYLIIA